jgi:hypothetical protein
MSNIQIGDVRFEKDFQQALSNEYGQTAIYLKDSFLEAKGLKMFDIHSDSGPSVL